jgi:hypothetical protein
MKDLHNLSVYEPQNRIFPYGEEVGGGTVVKVKSKQPNNPSAIQNQNDAVTK